MFGMQDEQTEERWRKNHGNKNYSPNGTGTYQQPCSATHASVEHINEQQHSSLQIDRDSE
jgi:hypothetical protein